jgi:sporulation protein YlmC with PRC-barrel domain
MAARAYGTTIQELERSPFIPSYRIEGTPVYGADGKHIGRIEWLMIDKLTGKVEYAVISFEGFFGIGADYYPIPWSMLRYTEKLGGYQVNITEAQLKNAPKFGANENWDWSNRQSVQNYWDISYPWPPDWFVSLKPEACGALCSAFVMRGRMFACARLRAAPKRSASMCCDNSWFGQAFGAPAHGRALEETT